MGLTFEDVWAMFQETDKKFQETDRLIKETRESQKETDRQMKESKAEHDRMIAETNRIVNETTRQIEKLSKNVGGMNRSLGELIETLIASRLWEKFPQYNFNRIFQRIKLLDEHKTPVTEIDILLSDDEWAMAVEVKREPDKGDVDHHLKRMELMRSYSVREISGKKLLGALAGGVVSPEVRTYAQKSGLFVLELNGEQVSLLKSPEDFVALQG
jgi:seryl-tRNA synthetase